MLIFSILLWSGAILAFVWIVDPYGVSPLHVSFQGVNEIKTRRLGIDRVLKPYEVWRYQPKTVFLGTSRIHQSIDPTILNRTILAPAYNASIPASTLSENAVNLEQFFQVDSNLKVVFVELFLSNFIFPDEKRESKTSIDFFKNLISLHLSATAVMDALRTFWDNSQGSYEGPRETAEGLWLPPKLRMQKVLSMDT